MFGKISKPRAYRQLDRCRHFLEGDVTFTGGLVSMAKSGNVRGSEDNRQRW